MLAAGPDGRIDPLRFAQTMRDKVARSRLNGQVPSWGGQFGIRTGSPDEWARFFTKLQQQESGHRIARTNPDGSLQRFGTTIPTEKSFGPGQFNIGEYGLKSWADVNNPDRVQDAYIRVAEQNKIPAYFGSVQRPREVIQHAKWYDQTIAPRLGGPMPAQPMQQAQQQGYGQPSYPVAKDVKPESGVYGFGQTTAPQTNAFSGGYQPAKWSDPNTVKWADGSSNAFGPGW